MQKFRLPLDLGNRSLDHPAHTKLASWLSITLSSPSAPEAAEQSACQIYLDKGNTAATVAAPEREPSEVELNPSAWSALKVRWSHIRLQLIDSVWMSFFSDATGEPEFVRVRPGLP